MKTILHLLAAFAMLVAPLASLRAATLLPGELIKASGPAVYYYHSDGKRYVFPNEKTYFTWYAGFTNIKMISDAELAAITIGGNVTYRPGVKMIKLTTDPKVYAVDGSKLLRWVKTEALAQSYYGADWAKQIDDLPDAFFADYETGTAIGTTTDYSRVTARDGKPTIGAVLTAATATSEVTMTQTKGTDFAIDLPSNPTTGYAWTATFSPAQFTQVSKVYTPATTTLVGSGGTDRFTFTPLQAGTWDIVFSYGRSWEPAAIDVRTYHVNVAEPTTPTTPNATSTVPGATFTLTASKTQAQANESLDLLAQTTYTKPVTKIEISVGDTVYTTCDSARTCSMAFTLPTIGLPDTYAYTAKFYTSEDGVIEAHASTQVVTLPVHSGILLTLAHAQLKPGQQAGILVQLAAGLNASKIVINVDGLDTKTCSSNPQSCRYDDVLSGDIGTVHTVYAWIQTPSPASLHYKSAAKTIVMASNDTPTITLSSSNASILPTETVNITAEASDGDGISSIEISRNGTVLKTCTGALPCTVTVGPFSTLSAGTQLTYDAKATDLPGASATASAMLVTIR